MPETGLRSSPKLVRGALVQLVEDVVGIVPNVIPFQYNPETLTRKMTPWNPFEVDQTARGQVAPTAQPFDPKESISLEIFFDAADQLEESDPVAEQFGVADRIAAVESFWCRRGVFWATRSRRSRQSPACRSRRSAPPCPWRSSSGGRGASCPCASRTSAPNTRRSSRTCSRCRRRSA